MTFCVKPIKGLLSLKTNVAVYSYKLRTPGINVHLNTRNDGGNTVLPASSKQ